jgi:hypothetical protein
MTTTHPLVGCTIIDTAIRGTLRGTITSVAPDGFQVGVTWAGRIGVSHIVPDTSGRFVVEVRP